MRGAFLALSVTVGLALGGCAGTPPPLPGPLPVSQNDGFGLGKSELVSKTTHLQRHLNDEQSLLYFQNQGGGGMAVGLLGPFGIAANVKMIEAVTDGDVQEIKGKVVINPEAAFVQAATDTGFVLQSTGSATTVKLTPYVLISKTDSSTIHISSAIVFEGGEGQGKWVRRYQYQLPGKFTLDELADLSAARAKDLQAATTAGFASLLKFCRQGETAATVANEKKIRFTSAYLSPRFEWELQGSLIGENGGRVWVRNQNGVFAIDPGNINYKVVNEANQQVAVTN